MDLIREVVLQSAAVDLPLARAGSDADAGDGLLAAAGGSTGGDHGGALGITGSHGRVGVGAVGDLTVAFGERGDLGVLEVLGWGVSHCHNPSWAITGRSG